MELIMYWRTIRKHSKMQRTFVILLVLALVLAGVVVAVLILNRTLGNAPVAKAACKDPGLIVPSTPTLKGFINRSNVITTGKIVHLQNNAVTVMPDEAFKGERIKNDINLCPAQVSPVKLKNGSDVLLFLEGKDKDLWVLSWPYDGIAPIQNDHVDWGSGSYSLDEIRQAIKAQK